MCIYQMVEDGLQKFIVSLNMILTPENFYESAAEDIKDICFSKIH